MAALFAVPPPELCVVIAVVLEYPVPIAVPVVPIEVLVFPDHAQIGSTVLDPLVPQVVPPLLQFCGAASRYRQFVAQLEPVEVKAVEAT